MNLSRHLPVPLRHNLLRKMLPTRYFPSSTSGCGCPSGGLVGAAQGFHSSSTKNKKNKAELSSEPTRFSSSPANIQSMPGVPERNEYQPIIVALSMTAFILYFFLLREENDLDEQLNVGLFERIPSLEEPHLAQAIPRMKARGEDTTEAEARLKFLIAQRKMAEKNKSL